MKQKDISRESEIRLLNTQIQILENNITRLEMENKKMMDEKRSTKQSEILEESEIITLKSMISRKNRDIVSLEQKVAKLTRQLASYSISLSNVVIEEVEEKVEEEVKVEEEGGEGEEKEEEKKKEVVEKDDDEEDDEEDEEEERRTIQHLEDLLSTIQTVLDCNTCDGAMVYCMYSLSLSLIHSAD